MGDFLSGLFDAAFPQFNPDINIILAIAEWLLQLVLYVGQVLANALVAIAKYFFQGLVQIGQFFRHLWENFFKGLWRRLLHTLKSSQVWNDIRHGHILAFLRDLRALLDQLYAQFIRPILVMLQHIRQVLLILRALHIHIADQLDRTIAQIEGKIAGTFLQIRAVVNLAVDTLNLIMGTRNLLDSPHLLISLRRIAAALSVILTRRPIGYWFPSPRGAAAGFEAPVGFGFNPADPAQIPAASSMLGDAYGIESTPPIDIGFKISVTAVDKVDALDFFNDSLYAPPACSNPAQCLDAAIHAALGA